MPVNNDTTFNP